MRTGRLVRRSCPAREAAAERARTKAAKAKAAKAAREALPWMVGGLDMRVEIRRVLRAAGIDDTPEGYFAGADGKRAWRRTNRHTYATGHAYGHRVTMTVGLCTAAAAVSVILHEVAHNVAGCHHMHDREWQRTYAWLARKAYGLSISSDWGTTASATITSAVTRALKSEHQRLDVRG
jgi:hypothetical protein